MNTSDSNTMIAEDVTSKADYLPAQKLWKSYDTEDVNLFFSIVYRAIFNEDIFTSSNLVQKELLIDGENKEYHFQKMNKVIKMITENALKRIVNLGSFEAIIKIILEEKYPQITNLKLDTQAIVENILKNFKSIGDTQKVENLEGEATNEEKDMEQFEANLKSLLQNLENVREKLKSFEKQVQDLPQNVVGKLSSRKGDKTENKGTLANHKVGEGISKAKIERRDTSSLSTRRDSQFTKSVRELSMSERNGDQSIKASNDSSISISNTNGNGSHSNNERNDREENDLEDDTSECHEGTAMPEKSKLPKKATDILKTWFLNNIDHPYPTVETKELLGKSTGLNKKQIQNWFTNSRKRFLEPLKKKLESEGKGKVSSLSQFVLQQQQSNSDWTPNAQPSQPSQTQKSSNPEHSLEQANSLPQQATQTVVPNTYSIQQAQTQPTFFPQPVIIQNPNANIPQNGFYYSPATQPVMSQSLGEQNYASNYFRAPNGQILVPAGYLPQQQNTPVLMTSTPQGAYIVVNRPFQNYMPVGMVPMNGGAYMVPVQNYQYPESRAISNNQNMVDLRGMYAQNLSTNYNTIHNNVFNNISNTEQIHPQIVSYPQPVYVATKPAGMILEENKNYLKPNIDSYSTTLGAPNNANGLTQGSEGIFSHKLNPGSGLSQLDSRQSSMSRGQEVRLESLTKQEGERNQNLRLQESFGNPTEYREKQPEKKIHKEEAGPPINAFKK